MDFCGVPIETLGITGFESQTGVSWRHTVKSTAVQIVVRFSFAASRKTILAPVDISGPPCAGGGETEVGRTSDSRIKRCFTIMSNLPPYSTFRTDSKVSSSWLSPHLPWRRQLLLFSIFSHGQSGFMPTWTVTRRCL